MFTKVLIANRGEIAVRVMATCREMGIRTVAVYSEADKDALHVRQADEVYCIGPAPATQSYLCIDKIIETAKQSNAEAIHPGYGFLSENADFAEACAQSGIAFIGPSPSAMRLMGSKIAAKQLAQSVGVPTVPGYNGEDQTSDVLVREAERIGFPLLIKASAGGGGKGMRAVYAPSDFLEHLAGAQREAKAAFGDETVFLERLLQRPRHIEIQVLGDQYGNLIHLCERECSIQRRHQKILEESPSVALTPSLREEMGKAAVRLAQGAHYFNAGTVEFMLDADQQFYFLEMNTRLQVEHPVTEFVTGFDLVRHQLEIAAGEPLRITQNQVKQRGHAIEVRLYAEDPAQNFLPSTGTITRFMQPEGPGIRLDNGVEDGDEVTQYYDPMLAKLIVYAEDRTAAIVRLHNALQQSAIFGVTTNIPFLYDISMHPSFKEGQTHTSFLEEHRFLDKAVTQSSTLPDEVLMAAAFYRVLHPPILQTSKLSNGYRPVPISPWQTLGPWRNVGEARVLTLTWREKTYHIALTQSLEEGDTWHVQIGTVGQEDVTCTLKEKGLILLRRGATQQKLYVQQQASEIQVFYAGHLYHLGQPLPPDVEATSHTGEAAQTQKVLKAPMAGTIVKVHVHDGDAVQANQTLVILSAMKMEHAITAPYEGKVRHIFYEEGAVVAGGATLVEMQ